MRADGQAKVRAEGLTVLVTLITAFRTFAKATKRMKHNTAKSVVHRLGDKRWLLDYNPPRN